MGKQPVKVLGYGFTGSGHIPFHHPATFQHVLYRLFPVPQQVSALQEVVRDSRGNRYLCDVGYGLCERIN